MNKFMSSAARPLPLVIGHRGASAVAPENTLAAFERAMTDGADGIEFDVRLARDRVPVVIHDATLRRTGLMVGEVASLASTELAVVDVGTWFNLRHPSRGQASYAEARVPTLAQVLELFRERDATLYVEMKCELNDGRALAGMVAQQVRAHSLLDRVIVESFNHDSILEIKRIDSSIRTAALFEPRLARPLPSARKIIERAQACRADQLALHRLLAGRRLIEEAGRAGLATVVWTADNPSWVQRAKRYGVHAIITNNPALMSARLRADPSAAG
ncbi:MAG TPA: glycerophosphodiester phosphodiesterase family protein [Pyrinomonadaceae bacterium]|jgi:glycerophosphoryl diester phosphodiesterase|nr:glycerophosphodiester phosphodiesterase family protein [Pyrinomonadaceae bacterium]